MKFMTFSAAALAVALAPSLTKAKVTEYDVVDTQPVALEGRSFGDVGQYQRIKAKVGFSIDPKDPKNAIIVDIDKAPKDPQGNVTFSADVVILQPADPAKGNGKIFYEISNRGRNLSFELLNDAPRVADPQTADSTGNGHLLNQGYTIVLGGWQPNLKPELVSVYVPIADGVTGQSREEFVFDSEDAVVTKKLSYPATDIDPGNASLTVRVNETDPRGTVEGLSFRFVSDDEIEITRPQTMPAGGIYEFIYTAKDSKITGLGFAATRDLVSFLRGSEGHDVETPLSGIDSVLGLGISQAGRFARDFVYQGFNADESGNKVFDGLIAHIAGSRKTFTNYRFGQPGRYSRQHEDHDYPGDQFPFTYAVTKDPLTGKEDGILKTCSESDTCPKIMHSDTDTEFWQARGSLVSTDNTGNPVTVPENVRLYYLAGTQHFTIADAELIKKGKCVFTSNYFHDGSVMRGLLAALDDWVTDDKAPPRSRYPNHVGTSLVSPSELSIPAIPGLNYDGKINTLQVMDHSTMPPTAGAEYPIFVAAFDVSGNVIDGIKLPRIAVPLGTHMGWNQRSAGYAEGELCSLDGSYIPFAHDASSQDPNDGRPTVDELYESEAAYMAQVEAAIKDLLGQRLILDADILMLRERASQHWSNSMN